MKRNVSISFIEVIWHLIITPGAGRSTNRRVISSFLDFALVVSLPFLYGVSAMGYPRNSLREVRSEAEGSRR